MSGPDIFFDLAYAPLIHLAQNGTYDSKTALATSFGYADGHKHKVFRLTLRKDARFSDGSPVTSSAVKAWLEYYVAAGGPFANSFGKIRAITTPSPRKVMIYLSSPVPDMQWLLAQTNGAGFASARAGLADKNLTKKTYGAGPYVYVPSQSVPGETYTLLPNRYYWDKGAIHFSKVTITVVSTSSSLVEGMASGQFNVGVGSIDTIKSAKSSGLKVIKGSLSWDGLWFLNTSGASNPFSNKLVRQAVNYAINRPALVKGILNGQGKPTSAWVTYDGANLSAEKQYSYDPEEAKKLLAKAGYPHGVTLRLLSGTGSLASGAPALPLAEAMAQEMKAAGITLKTTFVAGSAKIADVHSGKFDATLASFGINNLGTYVPFFIAPTGFLNLGHTTFPKLNALVQEYLTSKRSNAVSRQVTEFVTKEGLAVPVFVPASVMFTAKVISNVAFPSTSRGTSLAVYPDPAEWR